MQQIEKPLFTIRDLRAYELQADDMPALQRFFEANPLYFKIVNGSPAAASEAGPFFSLYIDKCKYINFSLGGLSS